MRIMTTVVVSTIAITMMTMVVVITMVTMAMIGDGDEGEKTGKEDDD